MATLATLYDWFFPTRDRTHAAVRTACRSRDDTYALRPLPNEDIFFWVKPIDNSRVACPADPQSWAACWKFIGACSLVVIVLVGLLLPNALSILAGYEIHALERERQNLTIERTALELEEARLLSPERLSELAQAQDFVDPEPARVVRLQPQADGAVALNMAKH
jgi:hypothetical protein